MDVTAPAPSNAEQARAWDGDEGAYWADHAERFDRSIARYRFVDSVPIETGDRVLDVGCGTGETTRAAARRAGCASGIDLSARMIDVARRHAEREGLGNADFIHGDAQVHPFATASFDLAISRTGSMFFGDPVAAFRNIAGALRPGGRLVLLTWQPMERNEWITSLRTALAGGRALPAPPPAAPGPFSLSDPERVHALLTTAGFTGIRLDGASEPLTFGRDAADAETFLVGLLGWMLRDLDAPGRARALEALRTSLNDHVTSDGVRYGSAAWLVSAHRP